jgi:hypothetical protein
VPGIAAASGGHVDRHAEQRCIDDRPARDLGSAVAEVDGGVEERCDRLRRDDLAGEQGLGPRRKVGGGHGEVAVAVEL